jgi:hypothetical protein
MEPSSRETLRKKGFAMKKVIIASVMAIGLAACGGGGGDKAALVKACLADGDGTQKQCDCMADTFVKDLDPKVLKVIVEASKAEDSEAVIMSKMGELEPAQLQSMMTVMMGAAGTCGMEM